MIYYMVKDEFDQKPRNDGSILIKRELYTKEQVEKYAITEKCIEKIDVPQKATFYCFGARFLSSDYDVKKVLKNPFPFSHVQFKKAYK